MMSFLQKHLLQEWLYNYVLIDSCLCLNELEWLDKSLIVIILWYNDYLIFWLFDVLIINVCNDNLIVNDSNVYKDWNGWMREWYCE